MECFYLIKNPKKFYIKVQTKPLKMTNWHFTKLKNYQDIGFTNLHKLNISKT